MLGLRVSIVRRQRKYKLESRGIKYCFIENNWTCLL